MTDSQHALHQLRRHDAVADPQRVRSSNGANGQCGGGGAGAAPDLEDQQLVGGHGLHDGVQAAAHAAGVRTNQNVGRDERGVCSCRVTEGGGGRLGTDVSSVA